MNEYSFIFYFYSICEGRKKAKMETALISPANVSFFGIPAFIFSVLIPVIGVGIFIFIMNKRIAPLLKASPDFRFDRTPERTINLIKLWLIQYRQPRYMLAGVLHIMIFAGFIILSPFLFTCHYRIF